MMMQTPPTTGDDGLLFRLAQTAGATIFGALVALVTFRTRLALMDKELADIKEKLKDQAKDIDRRHRENRELLEQHMAASERRQSMLLEIVAGIARKVGADARFSDALVRYLTEEEEAKQDRR